MRLVELELGVGMESMMEKCSGGEQMGGDSVWASRGCSSAIFIRLYRDCNGIPRGIRERMGKDRRKGSS